MVRGQRKQKARADPYIIFIEIPLLAGTGARTSALFFMHSLLPQSPNDDIV